MEAHTARYVNPPNDDELVPGAVGSFCSPESHECNQRILRRQQSKSNPLIAVPFIYYRSTTKGGPSTGVTVDPLAMAMFGGERLTAGASETAGKQLGSDAVQRK
jgi:hypothetical protein